MIESERLIQMKQTEAQLLASKKYHKKLDNIMIRVPKGEKAILMAHATKQGESLNAFVKRAIYSTIEQDNKKK